MHFSMGNLFTFSSRGNFVCYKFAFLSALSVLVSSLTAADQTYEIRARIGRYNKIVAFFTPKISV